MHRLEEALDHLAERVAAHRLLSATTPEGPPNQERGSKSHKRRFARKPAQDIENVSGLSALFDGVAKTRRRLRNAVGDGHLHVRNPRGDGWCAFVSHGFFLRCGGSSVSSCI
jgi:hypothetical protein